MEMVYGVAMTDITAYEIEYIDINYRYLEIIDTGINFSMPVSIYIDNLCIDIVK